MTELRRSLEDLRVEQVLYPRASRRVLAEPKSSPRAAVDAAEGLTGGASSDEQHSNSDG